jgi:pimeloyl-ACP methyl ester carboxylesterase
MQSFIYNGIEIAFRDEGQGEPVVMVHGFASNKETNWVVTQWFKTITGAGRRAIALDNRGHGLSTKFYTPDDYRSSKMARDVAALMDHLRIERADIMGYSMGARITAFMALEHPKRVRSAVIGGLGWHLVDNSGLFYGVAEALEAPSLEDVKDNLKGYLFRSFAESTMSDLKALAACIRGSRQTLSPEELAKISCPTLVAVGSTDPIAGSGQALTDLIPGAQFLNIPGRDHMLATGDKVFKQGVLDFLNQQP